MKVKIWRPQLISDPPKVSIGLAVRNGRGVVERCIESVLAQEFTDLELVICDNASEDETIALLEQYRRDDRRVKVHANTVNIGSHENMNRALRLSQGVFFRWISADDWLEPECVAKCVQGLEANPKAIGVTTNFTIHMPNGATRYEEFRGEFPISTNAAARFSRMLWFYHAGDAKYDPIYGMYHRRELMATQLLRPSEQTDWLICAELALRGSIIHIHERLAHRSRHSPVGVDQAAFRIRLDPLRAASLRATPSRTYRELLDLVKKANLSDVQFRDCNAALRRFWLKETIRVLRLSASNVRHRLFGD